MRCFEIIVREFFIRMLSVSGDCQSSYVVQRQFRRIVVCIVLVSTSGQELTHVAICIWNFTDCEFRGKITTSTCDPFVQFVCDPSTTFQQNPIMTFVVPELCEYKDPLLLADWPAIRKICFKLKLFLTEFYAKKVPYNFFVTTNPGSVSLHLINQALKCFSPPIVRYHYVKFVFQCSSISEMIFLLRLLKLAVSTNGEIAILVKGRGFRVA